MIAKNTDQNAKIDFLKWITVAALLVAGIAANVHFTSQPVALRLIGWLVLLAIVFLLALRTTQGKGFWNFAQEARTELRKVVWPSRQETIQTTLIVVMMVVVVGLFLWGVDSIFLWLVGLLTGHRG